MQTVVILRATETADVISVVIFFSWGWPIIYKAFNYGFFVVSSVTCGMPLPRLDVMTRVLCPGHALN